MTDPTKPSGKALSRRGALAALGTAAAVLPVMASPAKALRADPPSVISNPPRDYSSTNPESYPDPDVIVYDPAFETLRAENSGIHRLYSGGMWFEGPAWSAQGRCLIWSDLPNNRQLRYLEEDGHVSVFRQPSNNTNGATIDHQGRLICCEHLTRRLTRFEHDGTVSVLADSFGGKHLNSPNDVAAHIDGSYWFSDPASGTLVYQGMPDAPGGPHNKSGALNPYVGQEAGLVPLKAELDANVYRVDPKGRVELVISEKDLGGRANGLCFSPDYRSAYLVSNGVVYSFDIASDGKTIRNKKFFADFMIDGIQCRADGIRCDVYGNLWCSSNAHANFGYSGVTVWTPQGKLLARIRLPENCGNITFGGLRRNRLFMCAGQSLYALYLNTQGAAPG